MAVLTQRIAAFDAGAIVWEYDYDDALLRLLRVRCTNNCPGHPENLTDPGPWATRVTLTVRSTGRVYTATVLPGDTLDQAVPTGAQTRLDITIDARGRVNGIDHTVEHRVGL